VLASATVSTAERGLLVLADGAQAAFAAGAVAELARAGVVWRRGAGAGLGAHVAVLAVLGEAAEAERRWLRDAELGCTLFRSRLAAAQQRLGPGSGVVVAPDPWAMDGWLDPAGLAEHLAPEMASVPDRLARAGASCAVAVEDLGTGEAAWVELARLAPERAGRMLRAAATFPAGWGPETMTEGENVRTLWGGVGVAMACAPPWWGGQGAWDVVCGFPAPCVVRTVSGGSLLELMQRRQETRAATAVGGWAARREGASLRLIAPEADGYRTWAARDSAELGAEYPLPWERNGELSAALVRFGAFVAKACGRVSDQER
jgi:hypothetical protein